MYLNFGYIDSLGQDCLHQVLPKRDPSPPQHFGFLHQMPSNPLCSLPASTQLQGHAALPKSHPEVMERIQVGTDRHRQAEPQWWMEPFPLWGSAGGVHGMAAPCPNSPPDSGCSFGHSELIFPGERATGKSRNGTQPRGPSLKTAEFRGRGATAFLLLEKISFLRRTSGTRAIKIAICKTKAMTDSSCKNTARHHRQNNIT